MKKSIIVLLSLSLCYACGLDESKATSLSDNYEVDSFNIKNDTIYRNQVPVAIKLSSIQRFDNSQVLIVKKIEYKNSNNTNEK